LKIIKCHLF